MRRPNVKRVALDLVGDERDTWTQRAGCAKWNQTRPPQDEWLRDYKTGTPEESKVKGVSERLAVCVQCPVMDECRAADYTRQWRNTVVSGGRVYWVTKGVTVALESRLAEMGFTPAQIDDMLAPVAHKRRGFPAKPLGTATDGGRGVAGGK